MQEVYEMLKLKTYQLLQYFFLAGILHVARRVKYSLLLPALDHDF